MQEERPHRHDAFETEVLTFADGMASDAVVDRLRALDVLRAKGFVATQEGVRLVQVVGRRIELTDVPDPGPDLLGRVIVVRRGAGASDHH